MKIKIYKEDSLFSQFIRLRDKKCVRCFSRVEFNDNGMPVTHQCSHYWGRGAWGTRHDPFNCDTLCFACHRLWGGDERREYEKFKRKQLGEKEYLKLQLRAHTPAKKDRKLALLYVNQLLEEQYESTR